MTTLRRRSSPQRTSAFWEGREQNVRRIVGARELFALRLPLSEYVFPNLQFDADGKVLNGLLDVIDAASPAFSEPGDVTQWLATAPSEPSPARLLQDGNPAAALERTRTLPSAADLQAFETGRT
jgi:hypothetical protein